MKIILTMCVLWCCYPTQANWEPLQRHLQDLQSRHLIPAMGLVIFNKAEAEVVTAWGEGVTVNTPFRIGSISKTFTALGLLLLAEEKNLDLNQPINKILNVDNPWQQSAPVKLIQLLELTGGFADLNFSMFSDNTPLSLSQAIKRSKPTTYWQPGLQHSYSNLPPGLTAAAIEHFSGESFEDYQQQHVFERLGMQDVNYYPRDDLPGGFKADGKTLIPYWHVTFNAFGAMNVSTQAMAEGLSHLFGQGKLSPQVIRRMMLPSSSLAARSGFQFDYAAGMYPRVSSGHVFYGHGGDADGYRSRFGLLPSLGRGYYLVINTDNPKALGEMQRVVEATLVKGLKTTGPPQTKLAGDFTGVYYPATTRFSLSAWQQGQLPTMEIRQQGSQLLATTARRKTRLFPLGGGTFRRRSDPVATVIFLSHENKTYLSGELGNFIRLDTAGCEMLKNACKSRTVDKPHERNQLERLSTD